ncbi:uncharacterized protein [Amphiura filiformis]|uniref:uncharacterized protein n=1 Tax=Amphiura filiformis TaxID=82378 RepID=UPI003B2137A3
MDKGGKAAQAKERGNGCMKSGRHMEAILHYTEAIKWTPEDYRLYSNRSLGYLKMEQHYLALEDANRVVELKPEWAKGYFRKAEVFASVDFHEAAVQFYKAALERDENDEKLKKAVKSAEATHKRLSRDEFLLPWKGIAVGAALGIVFLLLEFLLFSSEKMEEHLIKGLFLAMFIGGGFGSTQLYQYFITTYRNALLQPPPPPPDQPSQGTQTANNDSQNIPKHDGRGQSSSTSSSSNGVRQRAKKETK